MGRNADKRRAKQHGDAAGPSAEVSTSVGALAATVSTAVGAVATSAVVSGAVASGASATGIDVTLSSALVGGLELPVAARNFNGSGRERLVDDSDGTLARALFRITCLLTTCGPSKPADLRAVAQELCAIVEADTVSILVREGTLGGERLVLRGSHGLALMDEGLVSFGIAEGLAGHVASTLQTVVVQDAPRDSRFAPLYAQRTEIGSLVAAPLMFGAQLGGVVTASRREIRAFSPRDVDRFEVAAATVGQDLHQASVLASAMLDPVTKLGSRFALLLALPREAEISRRYRTELSLLMMDVDGLAAFNATHGRTQGDALLLTAAGRLQEALRAADLAVRLGDDELAILLPMTSSNNARAIGKRLLRTLAAPLAGVPKPPSWSVATATLGADEDTLEFVWRCDAALAAAKRQGGNALVTSAAPRRDLERPAGT